jgi:hypothetical protein
MDIAERMRKHVTDRGGPTLNGAWQMMVEAAAEIERLTRERDAARAALTFYRDAWVSKPHKIYGGLEWSPKEDLLNDCGNRARDALFTHEQEGDGK